ncbi:MAG: nicotinate-nucleotide adenylyltransferase [Ferruginibacter sp.]|nr:nicotinate-nucleotide adenylyltransferase [Ferruginibacter sp.]
MKVGLYFGSFNPVHIGHLIIANYCATQTNLDQVWFVISPQNPFKNPNSLLNEYHRLHMINSAIEEDVKLKASNVEFKLPKPSYTVDTLTYLKEKYPQHTFHIIMGSDSFQNLDKWKNYEQIIKHHHLYVYKRPGFKIVNTINATVVELNAPLLDISSTHIRKLIAAKKSIRFLVPDSVEKEILSNRYYQ